MKNKVVVTLAVLAVRFFNNQGYFVDILCSLCVVFQFQGYFFTVQFMYLLFCLSLEIVSLFVSNESSK